jgi:DNA-directed RNA polymerase subunit RPC12/RpoP
LPDQITNYQCPACGGPLHFDPTSQKLLCDYCGSMYTTKEIAEYYRDKNEAALAAGTDQTEAAQVLQWTEEEAAHMRAYSCPSCGAQLIADENTAATSCPYCGNPTVVPAQFDGALKPDYIIPFRLKKEEAVKKLQNYYGGKPMLPKAFSSQNHIEEIKGVYVPFWLYDGVGAADLQYHGTKSHSFSTANEHVTVVEHYEIVRKGNVEFSKVPADASSKMPDELMDSIEPYDYSQMVDFSMSYLPGYLADKYDVSAEDDSKRVDVRMKNTTINAIRQTISGYSLSPVREYININPGKVHYAFLPVWMLATKWNGQTYLFAMNGQTGKMVGDLPVDKGRFFMYFIAIAVIIAAIVLLIGFMTIH